MQTPISKRQTLRFIFLAPSRPWLWKKVEQLYSTGRQGNDRFVFFLKMPADILHHVLPIQGTSGFDGGGSVGELPSVAGVAAHGS